MERCNHGSWRARPEGRRVDTRANALVIWDEYEPMSGRLLLTCLG